MSTRKNGFKLNPPRNKQAKDVFYKELGRLLAQDAVWERKAANFGRLSALDRFTDFSKLPKREGSTSLNRHELYQKALDLFTNNEIVRPAINLISTSTFTKEPGGVDIRGKSRELKDLTETLLENNQINFHDLAREAELSGNLFLWMGENDGDKTEIWSLDPGITQVILNEGNIREKIGFSQTGSEGTVEFSKDDVQHLRMNATSTMQYGISSLRHLIYWINVLDTLFEQNWLRSAQYFGNPLIAITGVPGPYQQSVKTQIESDVQRAGRSWVLPPETDIKTPDLGLAFPINDIVGWVFRMISIGSEIPITLLGTADASSRGSAFFSNPRFTLAIKARREVWRIGLRQFFIKLFRKIGVVRPNQTITRKEFDFGFLPIFDRDLADLADVIEIYRDRKLISKKKAMELLGLDIDDEQEAMDQEPEDEPVVPNQPFGQMAKEAKRNKRKSRKNKRSSDY